MKLMLILCSGDTSNYLSACLKPLGFELIHYRHALKAMDNIDEAGPQGIIISARDFRRHWKTIVQFVRTGRPRSVCPVIVLTGKDFSQEDAAQAFYLGVSGLVDEDLGPGEMERLRNILERYLPVEGGPGRYEAGPWSRFGFVFANPRDTALVTGEVKTLSSGGLTFLPDHGLLTQDLAPGTELGECSLRVGDAIFSPVCRLSRTGRIAALEFVSLPEGEREKLAACLEGLPGEELKYLSASPS